jgi:hypothetical protein
MLSNVEEERLCIPNHETSMELKFVIIELFNILCECLSLKAGALKHRREIYNDNIKRVWLNKNVIN